MADVKPGQVWADNDWRCEGRTLRVDRIEGGKAVCTILTNSNTNQALLDSWAGKPLGQQGYACPDARDTRGKTTRISLSRFRPTSTGYRLVSEAAPVLDPDCRGGNHGGCIGPPGTRCDCRCHRASRKTT